jgi:hypothetical protein
MQFPRVQIALHGGQRSVSGDLAEHVDADPDISHPRQPRVPQIVSAKVLIPQPDHHLIPVGGVAKNGGGDPAASWSGNQPGPRVAPNGIEPPGDQVPDLRG